MYISTAVSRKQKMASLFSALSVLHL